MKIINFISGKDMGGPKQSFALYSELLVSMGHDVISVIRKGAPLKELLKSIDTEVVEVSYIRSVHPLFFKRSARIIKKTMLPYHAQVVLVHKQIDIPLVKAALGKHVYIVGVIHGFNARHTEEADRLIAVSEKVKTFLNASYAKPIFVIPNMVKIDTKPHYRDLPEVPLIGAMGIFRRKKGFHILIAALGILKKKHVNFHAIIAGRGRRRLVLHYLRCRYGLQKELVLKGWVPNDERDAFFDAIDIYCLPSRTESFGMVVVEAMGRMKRVVATRCGGPEEIISHGKDGYLVEKENPEAMAKMLEKIIKNSLSDKMLPLAAYKTVISKYEISAAQKDLSAFFEDLRDEIE